MPRIISRQEIASARPSVDMDESAELAEVIAALCDNGFNAKDEASLMHGAAWLARLGQNRNFLADILLDQLKASYGAGHLDNAYSPQSIMLSDIHPGFFLRANIWPSEQDHCFRASGTASFVYGAAHDHNFDFLTIGYFGPGYRSDYYEYDYDSVAGWRGEPAGLRFAGRASLSPGKLMHYRALRDVHRQIPPESLSISLNIMAALPGQGWLDQYGFDVDSGAVSAVLNDGASDCLLRIAVALDDGEALDIAQHFSQHHPSDRMRLAAYEARAMRAKTRAEHDGLWREAELSGRVMLAKEAELRRRTIAAEAHYEASEAEVSALH